MKFRFLNKTIEHQRFNYNPMYYDERKERIERKKVQYKRLDDGSMTEEERRDLLKDHIRENWTRGEYRQTQQRSSNLRIILLVCLILGLGYLIFNGIDEVDTIVEYLF
ncbi:MAG: hypothetical protein A3D92_02365 [Bacteroidetes bacterium RIFCSPHIGHO2_02_FULL_44_7]|nr:MAG: hypothetical protein A3D92_02365 [Bacteroidetes bacterium RIFCSPHIGHO2_02_FULL_44_7]